jgi:histone-lysine N-methyltransferase SETD3
MYEFSNPPSHWDEYICTIPQSFTTTSFWSTREIEEASAIDPRVKDFTLARRSEFALRYNDYIPYLTKRFPKLFPASFFNFRNFLWAATACYSRNWVVHPVSAKHGTHIMVPVLDLVNHQEKSCYVTFDDSTREFSIIAGPNGVKAGSEVMLSYGDKCNARLLTDYGFAVAKTDKNSLPDCT